MMKYIIALLFLISMPVRALEIPGALEWLAIGEIERIGTKYYLGIGNSCYVFDTANELAPGRHTLFEVFNERFRPLTPEEIAICHRTYAWKVAANPRSTDDPPTRPLKDIEDNDIGRIAVGMPCEPATVKESTVGREWHYATNAAGLTGLAVCERVVE